MSFTGILIPVVFCLLHISCGPSIPVQIVDCRDKEGENDGDICTITARDDKSHCC